jgi:hypothetical protein
MQISIRGYLYQKNSFKEISNEIVYLLIYNAFLVCVHIHTYFGSKTVTN